MAAMRTARIAGGLFCLALAGIGAVLPLMPTTIFVILAAGCFARSSPTLEARILAHRRFGPLVRDWRVRRAIPLRGKAFALGGMTLGYALFYWSAWPDPMVALGVAAGIALCGLWILGRPS